MPDFLDAAIEIAREAGQLLMAHRGVGFELKGTFDLVTAADRASEQLVIKRLQERFPEHGIVAEEGGGAELKVAATLVCRSARRHYQLRARLSAVERHARAGPRR